MDVYNRFVEIWIRGVETWFLSLSRFPAIETRDRRASENLHRLRNLPLQLHAICTVFENWDHRVAGASEDSLPLSEGSQHMSESHRDQGWACAPLQAGETEQIWRNGKSLRSLFRKWFFSKCPVVLDLKFEISFAAKSPLPFENNDCKSSNVILRGFSIDECP